MNFGHFRFLAVFFIFLVSALIRLLVDLWIGLWPQYAGDVEPKNIKNSFSSLSGHTDKWFAQGYIVIVCITVFLVFWRSWYFISIALSSSKNLHNRVMKAVLSAPINLYFDITPIGRILNR